MSPAPTPPPSPDDLEAFIHRTLRAQPERTAPDSLEQRVLARLAAASASQTTASSASHPSATRRTRARWADWPPVIKGLFVTSSTVAVLAVFQLLLATRERVASETQGPLNLVTELARAAWRVGTVLFESIPAPWLYAGAFALALGHLALFGVGSLLVRTLRATA